MIGHDVSAFADTTVTIAGADYRSTNPFAYQAEPYSGTTGSEIQWNHTTVLPADYSVTDDSDTSVVCEASSKALDRWALDNPY